MLVALLAACGASARQKALSGALLAVDAAGEGFAAWSDERQGQIVAAARARGADREEVHADLAAFRDDRRPVIAAFTVAYRAIAAASVNAATPLPDALDAVSKLAIAIADLKAAAAAGAGAAAEGAPP